MQVGVDTIGDPLLWFVNARPLPRAFCFLCLCYTFSRWKIFVLMLKPLESQIPWALFFLCVTLCVMFRFLRLETGLHKFVIFPIQLFFRCWCARTRILFIGCLTRELEKLLINSLIIIESLRDEKCYLLWSLKLKKYEKLKTKIQKKIKTNIWIIVNWLDSQV